MAILISMTANALPAEGDGGTLVAGLVLTGLSLYLQIAVTLAAADPEPGPSMDGWLREAWGRRVFWRYFVTSVLVVMAILAGAVGLLVGAFFVGGVVALADPAVVLERRRPVEAVARSAELGRPVRGTLMVVFGILVLIPTLTVQVGGLIWDLPATLGVWWSVLSMAVVILGMAAAVALARVFLILGGTRVPVEGKTRI